jgi:GDPmannose 4,6-dehydratase
MKTALITGADGQDGTLMAARLAARGYRVVGTVRRDGGALARGFEAITCDISEPAQVERLLDAVAPDEIYNFAAMSSGAGMYETPAQMGVVNGLAPVMLVEALRRRDRPFRFCQASSSELFGNAAVTPQDERTPIVPRSPYGAAKAYAHFMMGLYRTHYGLFCCSAILYNHESPLRSTDFVTRKITQAAARIHLGLLDKVGLGDIESRRDWGYAGDYVEGMWAMLQQPRADDYVLATGQPHSVRELCEIAFSHVGLDYRHHVEAGSAGLRRADPVQLVGNPHKAADMLGWKPTVGFREMITAMVDHDIKALQHHL